MATRLPEYSIESDAEGFFLVDEYGEEVTFGWCLGYGTRRRWWRHADAVGERIRREKEDIEAYDGPPDGDAWSGGFAENH